MTERLLVVGASLAGIRSVEAARRHGFEGDITMIGAEAHLPYDRPPLSKRYLTGESAADYYRTEDAIRDELRVDLRLGTCATALRADDHTVATTSGDVAYDRLIIATGAAPRTIPGVPALAGIVTLRTLDDADRLRESIRPGAHVVILGAGFIGSEIASSATHLGAEVTVIEAAPVPLVRAVGDVVGRALAGLHQRHGTRLLMDTRIVEYLGSDRIEAVRLSNGDVLRADVVVVGIGAAPATEWLRDSGIGLHPLDGGIICDEYLQSSLPGVYAAGDVAHWPNGALDLVMRLENWTNAADQAAQAGANAADPSHAERYETVPYFWSDWYGQRIQFVGTATAEAVEFASGSPDDSRFVALYRTGDRLVGAATLDERKKIMKLRRHIAERGLFSDAIRILEPATQPAHT
ncbi:NAD(P)/FAD-dependent oxidoreductase [Leifsonia naganoensis]|uniref:NADPH-dependent 2,4-dienoyl-CoA reductase/sulfur reductase-like enzyme n=1 Tax=Leifsonia naganoensis TaxID=150025 RepID=A0A853DLQ1_9MICO|nr:FAD-dependent oxidoreductase [Leifsonia naganoensis]NYK09187.1 NADPH-dependent 2,4-dienoyl-CoA reductase/sulfur reductase-like enzyme [Leifsonia naganoensis]